MLISTWRRLPLHATVIVIVAALAGCATNPATGESQVSLISEQQEIQIGRDSAQQVRQTLGLVDDDELQAYVNGIGQRIAAGSERPNLPWSFEVVDDPTPNAFALPGGFIFITRGMMNLLTSEAQLASVLGHEVAHVTARHAVNQISKQQLAQLGVGLGGVLVPEIQQVSPAIGAGLSLLFLKYSRDDERQADELGFEYIRQQGFDVTEFAPVFSVLARTATDSQSAIPNWLSTHPAPQERVQAAEERARQVGPQPQAIVGRDTYLRQIDGLVFGEDPRQGFFRDGVFYHPELRFQVGFPANWETRNLTQAVVAAAPQGAAAFELSLVPGEPAQALQAFAQQNVQLGAPSQTTVNGLPATTAEFVAQTQQGEVRGIVTMVRYDGRTYQMVGYTERSQFARHADTLQSITRSFNRVTDPDVLGVQPERIDIVELDESQTLQQFASRHASAVPVDQLAVINQLPSASTPISAGTLVKRVIS